MKKIAIVEPHFDDAWLNLGGRILKNSQNSYIIITISDHPSNDFNGLTIIKEKLKLNMDLVFLGYKSLGFDDPTIKEAEEKYGTKNHKDIFLKMNGLKDFSKIRGEIKNAAGDSEVIFWPLGIKHPQHILMDFMNPFESPNYYREFPYYFYPDQKDVIDKKAKGLKKVVVDILDVFEKKKKLFALSYEDQKFLLDLKISGKNFSQMKEEVFWEKA